MEKEPVSSDIIKERISKNPLWRRIQGGYYETIIYPQHRDTVNFLLTLRTACSLEELKNNIGVIEDKSPIGKREGNYFLSPHFLVFPNIWISDISDGHRFLFSMIALFRETMGRLPCKILSLDLDYFSRIPPRRIKIEIDNLISAASVALQMANVVIADMHEDVGCISDFIEDTTIRQVTYVETVGMLNRGEVTDDNFLPFVIGRREEGILIKPPLIEYSFTRDIKKGCLNLRVFNAEQLISLGKDFENIPSFTQIDMIHICTSPSYINFDRAFSLLFLAASRFARLTEG